MTETAAITPEVAELHKRLQELAGEKAHLEMLNNMLTRLSMATGLENVVSRILDILTETVGGANLTVYHTIDGNWFYTDIFRNRGEMRPGDDALVARCIRERTFVRADEARGPARFPAAATETWLFPLGVGERAIGAVRIDGIHPRAKAFISDLTPFFTYAALMLDHEITNYSAFSAAYEQLKATNREMMQEIAARKEAETLYRTIVEHSPDGIVLIDPPSQKFVQFNTAACRQLGYSREEFAGLAIPDIESRETAEDTAARMAKILAAGHDSFETIHRTKDGNQRNVHVTATVLELSGRTVTMAIFRDITDSRKLEQEILKTDKLESLGILAGGIAHDFNNLLTAIMGNISLARLVTEPGEKAEELLGDAEKAALRARDLTQQLLTFAKGGEPVKKIVSLAQLIRENASFAVRGSKARCEFSLPANLWPVEVDEGQISQVIHNLMINADQAMPMGGVVEVRCENVSVHDNNSIPLKGGKYVRISIADQGIGIPRELLPSIFDPYFTTKQKGSGLGLATSYSIIKRHNGLITVDTEPGRGTTFHIYLPARAAGSAPKPAEKEPPRRGSGKILVMDDEEFVLEIIIEMLQEIGYDAEGVRDGADVIERYAEAMAAGAPFDLVIMDLTVPGGTGGKEAMRKMRELDPKVKAIVSSGYSNDPIMAEYREFGFVNVLVKPYVIEALSTAVADALAG